MLDGAGWFRTGDAGFLDDRGLLHVTGRLKDIIIRKGENISAKEVEDVLFFHPAIADVAVIALPDRERGELCCAVVVLNDGRRQDLSRAGIICFAGQEGLDSAVLSAAPRTDSTPPKWSMWEWVKMTAATGLSPRCSLASAIAAAAVSFVVRGSTMIQPVCPSIRLMFEISKPRSW